MSLAILGLRPPRPGSLAGLAFAMALTTGAYPPSVAAQFSNPCSVACALTLGVTSVAAATGGAVAWGRHTGGLSTAREAIGVWGAGLVLSGGAGIALSGNGGRQRRAVYAAGVGAVTGSLLGLSIGALSDDSGRTREVAGTLMGAAAGAMLGGLFGALSHEGSEERAAPVLSVQLRF